MIEPGIYQRALESMSLRSVSLDAVSAVCDKGVLAAGGISVNLGTESFSRQAPNMFLAYCRYVLEGLREAEQALKIEATFCVTFDITESVPDGFFEVYRESNLGITTMPFARELFASVTSRMDIPTLTLPYHLFIPIESVKEDRNTSDDPPSSASEATVPQDAASVAIGSN